MHVLNDSVEQKTEAIQLLDLIIDEKLGELSSEESNEIQKTLWSLLQKNHDDPMLLQVLIKVIGSSNFTEELSEQLSALMTKNFVDVLSPDYDESLLPFTLKLLSKSFISSSQNIINFLENLLEKNIKISEVLHKVVTTPKHFAVINQLLQFIAFIHIYPNPIVAQYFTFDPPSTWKIPKLFEF